MRIWGGRECGGDVADRSIDPESAILLSLLSQSRGNFNYAYMVYRNTILSHSSGKNILEIQWIK